MKIKHLLFILWFVSPFIRWWFLPMDWKHNDDFGYGTIVLVHWGIWIISCIVVGVDLADEPPEDLINILNKEITLPKVKIKRKDAFLEQLQKQYKEAYKVNDKEEMRRLENSINLMTK